MSKIYRKNKTYFVIALISSILLLFVCVNKLVAIKVYADETEAKLVTKQITVGVGNEGLHADECIKIENYNYGAEYTFTFSNKKIAYIDRFTSIIGKAKGTSTITVTETIDGVSRNLGEVALTVTTAKLDKEVKVGLSSSNLRINYENYSATYSYKSEDPKIVKVDKFGNLEGVKYGSAYVSVTEKYKGKVTKIGSIKVNVVKAQPAEKALTIGMPRPFYAPEVRVDYPDRKVLRRYTSANTKIVKVNEITGDLTGVKYGKTTITITGIDENKEFKIGTVAVEVVGGSIDPEDKDVELWCNSEEQLSYLVSIENRNMEASYTCEAADESIVSVVDGIDSYGEIGSTLKGLKEGTTQLTIYETLKRNKRLVGTVNITIK